MENIDKQFIDKVEASKIKFHKQDREENTQKIVEKLDELKPKETMKMEIVNDPNDLAKAFFSMLRGPKGEDGHTPTDEEITTLIKPLIPDPIPGKDGRDGIDGKDGKDGVDGLNGLDGKDGVDGKDGLDGKNGKDGSPDTPEQIVEKLQTLKEAWIEVKAIKGLDELLNQMGNNFLQQARGFVPNALAALYDVDVNNIANGQALIWDITKRKFVPGATTGGGLTQLTATGTVDGNNTAFTFTTKPTFIVSDGAWYVENSGWTWSAGTATMSVPPQTGIWGFA